MNRKNFIKTTGLGLGVALIPLATIGKSLLNQETPTSDLKPKIIRDGEGNVLNVLGDIQTHKLYGKDTANQIVEWVDDVEPGVGIPPHFHTREDEIFRVIKGQIEMTVDGKTTVLKAGDTAFAPKNIPHAWTVVGTEKAKMITSAFPAGIEMMFSELANLPPGPPDMAVVLEIVGRYGIEFV
jgi:quercetin dioxygenase-like cupin family protein